MSALHFVNDFKESRRNAQSIISKNLEGRGELSVSYIAQLFSATVVCTLGLITDSTAVIIGGMIIAPLMWPILNVSYRLSTKRSKISFNPLFVLVISTFVIFLGAALVALLTPYKEVTSEMLARTTPTSLEIFIALAAALIAALAVALPKIGDSVAGVAVATSLVPPLCVSGIGLAYFNIEVLYGSLLLFLTNALTIMLVSTFIFSFFIFGRDFTNLKKKQVTTLVVAIIILSFPLYWRLEASIASASVSNLAKSTIEEKLAEYAPNSEIENYQVKLSSGGSKVSVRAVVLLPPARTISFEQEQDLSRILATKLGKEVDLQLVQQDSIQPVTEKEIQELSEKNILEEELATNLREIEPTIQINTLNSQLSDDNEWNIVVSVRATFELNITADDINSIEESISLLVQKPVTITMELIESKIVGGEQSERESALKTIQKVLLDNPETKDVINLYIDRIGRDGAMRATAVLLVDESFTNTDFFQKGLERKLSTQLKRPVRLTLSFVESKNF